MMLEQRRMSVEEYYRKFIELMRFAPEIAPTKEAKASHFELGLTLDLQGRLGGGRYLHLIRPCVWQRDSSICHKKMRGRG